MFCLFYLQVSNNEIEYVFNNDILEVTMYIKKINEKTGEYEIYKTYTDSFDFSYLRVGDVVESINTTLPLNPIISIEREEDGLLYAKLLKYIDKNHPDVKNKPMWKEI